MIPSIWRLIFLFGIPAFVISCREPSMMAGKEPSISAADLMNADPAQDVRCALRRGERRFLVVSDFAESVPGAGNRPEIVNRYGTKRVFGTSDTAPEEIEYNALDYAEVYNRLLLRYLAASGEIARRGPFIHGSMIPPQTLNRTVSDEMTPQSVSLRRRSGNVALIKIESATMSMQRAQSSVPRMRLPSEIVQLHPMEFPQLRHL